MASLGIGVLVLFHGGLAFLLETCMHIGLHDLDTKNGPILSYSRTTYYRSVGGLGWGTHPRQPEWDCIDTAKKILDGVDRIH